MRVLIVPKRLARLLRNLRMGQALEKRQLQRRALIGIHLRQHAANFLHHQRALRLIPQIRTAGNNTLFDVGLRPPLAQPVDGPMTRDHRQPCRQASPAGVERIGIAP